MTGARLAEITRRAPPAPRARRGGTLAGPGARRPRHDGLLRRPRHRPRATSAGESGVGARVRLDRVPIVAGGARDRARGRGRRARVGGERRRGLRAPAHLRSRRGSTASSQASPKRPAPPSPSSGEIEGSAGEIVFVDADGATVPIRGGYRALPWIAGSVLELRRPRDPAPALLRAALRRRGRLLLAGPGAAEGAGRAAGQDARPPRAAARAAARAAGHPPGRHHGGEHRRLRPRRGHRRAGSSAGKGLPIAIGAMVFLLTVFGEVLPMTLAVEHPLRFCELGEPAGGVAVGRADADPHGPRRLHRGHPAPGRLRAAGRDSPRSPRRSCARWWTWARARAWWSGPSAR